MDSLKKTPKTSERFLLHPASHFYQKLYFHSHLTLWKIHPYIIPSYSSLCLLCNVSFFFVQVSLASCLPFSQSSAHICYDRRPFSCSLIQLCIGFSSFMFPLPLACPSLYVLHTIGYTPLFSVNSLSLDLSDLDSTFFSYFRSPDCPFIRTSPLCTGWAQLWHGPTHEASPVEDHLWRSEGEMCRGSHLSQVREVLYVFIW